MTQWTYIRRGNLSDDIVRDVSLDELQALACAGEIDLETLVSHPQHIKSEWIPIARIPSINDIWQHGAQLRMKMRSKWRAERKEWFAQKAAALRQLLSTSMAMASAI